MSRPKKNRPPSDEELFPGCSKDEKALGRVALRRTSDVLAGRVEVRSAPGVLAAAAYLLAELYLNRSVPEDAHLDDKALADVARDVIVEVMRQPQAPESVDPFELPEDKP